MNITKNATITKNSLTTKELALIGLMAAVMCVLGPISVPIPISPVMISLGNMAILLAVYVLGTKRGLISYLIYLFLGTVGLPVFTGVAGGLGKVVGPTGGYLIGYFFMIGIAGYFINRFPGKKLIIIPGMFLGTVVCNMIGTIWLSHVLEVSFVTGLASGVLPYLPGDLAKVVIAAWIGPILKKAVRNL